MSFQKYAQWAYMIAEEYRGFVTNEDAAALRSELRAAGEAGWLAWVAENQAPLLSYLSDTDAKRQKRKQWADPVLRPRICLVAYRNAHLAGLLLDAAEQLVPGGGYRDICESTAHAALELLEKARWFWPFDGEPPFPGWQPPEDLGHSVSYGGPVL